MKKILTKCVQIISLCMIVCILFSGCKSTNEYTGTWAVSEYKYGGKYYTTDEMTEMMGSKFCEVYGKITISFSDNDELDMGTPSEIDHGSYKISDKSVLIYDESGELAHTASIVEDALEIDIPDSSISLVFKKQ